jgi:predicted dehydrogenase
MGFSNLPILSIVASLMFQSVAAVVGTGFIGPVHIEGLQRAGVRVRGVLGTSLEKSQRAAKSYGLERAYTSLAELLDDPQVTAVHLTSPNRFHFDQAMQCMDAGKHVLCEKPLAMNSRESLALVQRAKASQVRTAVNYNVRYYPICLEAAQRIQQGELGEVFHVSGSYVQDWLHQETDFNWRVLGDEGGPLRALADIGTHWLDLVQSICRLEVAAVCADLQTVHPIRQRPVGTTETFTSKVIQQKREVQPVAVDTEDYGSVLLRFCNGTRGVMHVSQVTAGHKNLIRWEIAGSKQAMAWSSLHPDELWIGHRDHANQTLLRDPGLLSGAARNHAQYPGGHNEGFADTFKQLFRSFYNAIETSKESGAETLAAYPTFDDGHREIVLCECILRSAREQRWIDVPNDANPS